MNRGPRHPERSFGVSVGAVLCALAAVLAWRGHHARAAVLTSVGVLLVAGGLWAPRLLRLPSSLWWRFSRALGTVNARVLLTLIYAVVLTPLALIWRMTGRDPLARRRSAWPGWSPHPARYRDPRHYSRMY